MTEAEKMEDPLWYEIVWGQFQKRRLAFRSLGGVGILMLIAIYAPIFVSNKPFLWNDGSGWSSPWLVSLFDRNFFDGRSRHIDALEFSQRGH